MVRLACQWGVEHSPVSLYGTGTASYQDLTDGTFSMQLLNTVGVVGKQLRQQIDFKNVVWLKSYSGVGNACRTYTAPRVWPQQRRDVSEETLEARQI